MIYTRVLHVFLLISTILRVFITSNLQIRKKKIKEKLTCPKHTSNKGQSRDLNSDLNTLKQDPEPLHFILSSDPVFSNEMITLLENVFSFRSPG